MCYRPGNLSVYKVDMQIHTNQTHCGQLCAYTSVYAQSILCIIFGKHLEIFEVEFGNKFEVSHKHVTAILDLSVEK